MYKLGLLQILLTCLCLSCSPKVTNELVIDKSLSAFEILNGTALYEYENGTITGASMMNTPNTFLATKRKYTDFILEFDVWVDVGLNSGVQIRSNSQADYHNGRVHGYQVEIDTSPRRWSGGIYDEARRAWLYPLSLNKEGQKAFNNEEWNHYRIEAIGDEIRTWINGVPCAYLIDDMTSEGFIAFQVHSIYDQKDEGKKVRWKNIRLNTTDLMSQAQNIGSAPEESYLENKLSKSEMANNWQMTNSDKVDVSDQNNVELKVDFKLPPESKGAIVYGEELQFFLSNDKTSNLTLGSINEHQISKNLSEIDNPSIRYKGDGNWNRAHIIKDGSTIQHWLNGVLIVDTSVDDRPIGPIELKSTEGEIEFKNFKWRVW